MLRRLSTCGGSAALAMALAASSASAQTHTFAFTPISPDGVQSFVVPTGASMLTIVAEGASGGKGLGISGGAGGRIRGDVAVPPGTELQLLIGRRGASGNSLNDGPGGGGGGTFVAIGSNGLADFATPLLVAGGGGGRSLFVTGSGGILGGSALGGSGNGGSSPGAGGGGGGILSDGASGRGGQSPVNGGAGGAGPNFQNGGFGGGGGGATTTATGGFGGGGGGGYTGGNGGTNNANGKGGTSYAAPEVCNVVNSPGAVANSAGSVTIYVHYTAPTTHVFQHTGSLQTFVVPAGAAKLAISASGGAGGGASSNPGGAGGRIDGDVCLPPGTTLQLLVGRRGRGGTGSQLGGSGGGGTFVAVGTSGYPDFVSPLLVAGGGGGRGRIVFIEGGVGGLTLGGSGDGGSNVSVAGCGAGIASDGANGTIANGGQSPQFGGAGGSGHRAGGYGGGGGSAQNRPGGGGGYTGGISGTDSNFSTGGSSYAAPEVGNVVNAPGANVNVSGSVTITVYYAATVEPLGQGCSGDVLTANGLPFANETFDATGTGLPQTSLVLAVTGFTPTVLPLIAAFPQASPGCDLLVTPDLIDVLITTTGTVTSSLALPATPSLAGQQFFQQMVSLEVDGALNVLDVTATNALHATIGL